MSYANEIGLHDNIIPRQTTLTSHSNEPACEIPHAMILDLLSFWNNESGVTVCKSKLNRLNGDDESQFILYVVLSTKTLSNPNFITLQASVYIILFFGTSVGKFSLLAANGSS